tara:strand:- start:327 stop:620 length:294 start_codon:yes stop_codon:yes gene_type:complete
MKTLQEFFTLQELKELKSSFKSNSYISCGNPEQPIVRKSILRKIEKAIDTPKLNDEQIENLTHSLTCNLRDYIEINTGFIPSREDIIKCLDNALQDL